MASSLSHFPATSSGRSSSSDLLRSSFSGTMVPANMRRKRSSVARRKTSTVVCFMNLVRFWKKKKHEYPWPNAKDVDPNVKGGMVSYLSDFKPLKEKPKPVILPFEKHVKDLEKEINDIRKVAEETGAESPQINGLIAKLEKNYEQAQNQLYSKLTPIQRLTFARHPNRPTFLDHVLNMTDMWVELHGDRAGYDDPAIVTGLGRIDGKTYMLIGHQKGRNTKENIHRNFAMPTPHGYRKALRMMRYADHHGFPIITFIDTPGAFPDIKSEHKGQGEAIAFNLRTMFGLKVPIVTVVIGEGGSGGALAIGCGNKILMLENSVFYVASPEACASILWKNPKAVPKAAERLKITATELCKLKIADGVIPEPLGGAHMDPFRSSQQIKIAVLEAMNELSAMDTETLLDNRRLKFRILGSAKEAEETDAKKTRNMKKEDRDFGSEIKILKDQLLHSKESTNQTWNLQFDEFIESLEKAISQEYSDAIHALGFQSRLDKLRKEVAKARRSPDQPLEPALQDKMDKLNKEFERKLAEAPNAPSLKAKLSVLDEAIKVKKISEKRQTAERLNSNLENRERLKQETNIRLKEALENSSIKGKLEALKKEVSRSGASNWEDLDEGLKDNIMKMKKEIQLTLSDTLKSMQLNAEKQVSQSAEYNDQRLSELKDQLVDLSEQIKKEVMHVIDSMGWKSKIKTLKMEAAKAGKSSNVDVSNKIKRLEERMKQAVKEVMGSSELVKKHQMLVQEMRNAKIQASSAEDDQSSGGNAGKETALSSIADAFHDLV